MRIVHCEDFFHPDAGYQVNILSRYMQSKGHEVIVLTSEINKMPVYLTDFFVIDDIEERDKNFTSETGVQIIRMPLLTHISGRSVYYPGYFKKLTSLKPDILYIHGVDTYLGIRCLWRLKKLKCPIIFDIHMTDIASINPFSRVFRIFFRTFIAPIINEKKVTVIRVHNENFVNIHYGISHELTPYIGFGSNLQLFHPDMIIGSRVRNELNISENDFVVVYAGKLDESKGGLFLAEALKEKLNTNRNIIFLVIGNVVSADETYNIKVKETILKSQNKIVHLPTQSYRFLCKYFQCADIAVFPKQCSLTFFDAQACGLPVVLEDNDINIERVKHGNGVVFKTDDIADFRDKITMMANMPEERLQAMKKNAENFIKDNYDYDIIADRYLEIITRVADEYGKK